MNLETPLRQTAWAALVLVLASGCGAPSRGRDGDEPAPSSDAGADAGTPTACTPGNGQACTCSDGRAGQATCLADGSSYGQCLCDGGSVCEPRVAAACTCAGGEAGTRQCNASGSAYGACVCTATPRLQLCVVLPTAARSCWSAGSGVSPPSFQFGEVLAGTSVDGTLELTNLGGGALEYSVSLAAQPAFAIVGNASGTLTTAASASVIVRFASSTPGTFGGDVNVSSNDANAREVTVAVAGRVRACVASCSGKECGDDGCGGLCGAGTCATPPATTCANATTRLTYAAAGTCSAAGKCSYSASGATCANGCANGACQSCVPSCSGKQCGFDGCGGVCGTGVCATPPATTCANGTTLQTYAATGTCSAAGACSYSTTTSVCPAVTNGTATCSSGTCGFTCNAGYVAQAGQCVSAAPAPAGMALVPAGAFYMGCNSAVDTHCETDESPYHQVTLSAFYVDVTEVTQAAYKTCVDAGRCTVPGSDWDPATRGQKPVVSVDWNQSKAYCEWEGKRLPTEAEWEKAARGTDGRIYPWGNQTATCQYAVMPENGAGCGTWDAMAVGSMPAGDSPYGLHDMAGNVWEWVSDWYGTYPSSAAQDPQGSLQGTYRVLRGGGWGNGWPSGFRAAYRNGSDAGLRNDNLGFRCARGAVP